MLTLEGRRYPPLPSCLAKKPSVSQAMEGGDRKSPPSFPPLYPPHPKKFLQLATCNCNHANTYIYICKVFREGCGGEGGLRR